MSQIEGDAEE